MVVICAGNWRRKAIQLRNCKTSPTRSVIIHATHTIALVDHQCNILSRLDTGGETHRHQAVTPGHGSGTESNQRTCWQGLTHAVPVAPRCRCPSFTDMVASVQFRRLSICCGLSLKREMRHSLRVVETPRYCPTGKKRGHQRPYFDARPSHYATCLSTQVSELMPTHP